MGESSDYEFVWFDRKSIKGPTIFVAEYGLALGPAVLRGLEGHQTVRIGFDKQNEVMALVPNRNTGEFSLTTHRTHRRINCKAISKRFTLGRYAGVWDASVGGWVFDMSHPEPQKGGGKQDASQGYRPALRSVKNPWRKEDQL